MSRLEQLPVEVLLPILCQLDIPDIASCLRLSKYFNATIKYHAEVVYAALAHSAGYTRSSEVSDVAVDRQHPSNISLQQAIKNQQSALRAYDDCKTWRQFVKRRRQIVLNWDNSKFSRKALAVGPAVGSLRIDAERGLLMLFDPENFQPSISWRPLHKQSAQKLPQLATAAATQFDWENYIDIQLCGGFLIFLAEREIHICELDSDLIYQPQQTLTTGHHINDYKVRYPLVAGASATSQLILIWNLVTGHLEQSISLASVDRDFYDIDFDDAHVFLVEEDGIQVFSRKDGAFERSLPAFKAIDNIWLCIAQTRNHVVSVSAGGHILIICRNGPNLPENLQEISILGAIENVGFCGCSVDEDRCVFTGFHMKDGEFVERYLLSLKLPFFDSTYAFEVQNPQVQLLAEWTAYGDIEDQVALDNSAIYVKHGIFNEGSNITEDGQKLIASWQTIDGGRFVGLPHEITRKHTGSPHAAKFLQTSPEPGNAKDVFVYSFAEKS